MEAAFRAAWDEFVGLGFSPVPVAPATKRPHLKGWPTLPVDVALSRAAPDDILGLRGGGEVQAAFLDCDERKALGTFAAAQRWLAGLGYMPDGDFPVVRTASGIGRHIYVSFEGGLPGHCRTLAPDFGAGEFRYGSAAIVVAPPSPGYELLAGDYRQLPRLELVDVLPILRNQDTLATLPTTSSLPIPRTAQGLLNGKGVARYPSRSEAEQAIITALVNTEHDFGSILALFLTHPAAGKFAELRQQSDGEAVRWLRLSYDNAKKFVMAHPSPGRSAAISALAWANSRSWQGRTGSSDRAAFQAHAIIAKRAGALVYAASCRDLAELAGTTAVTASKATRRLVAASMVVIEKPAVGDRAVLYRLGEVQNRYTSSLNGTEEVYHSRTRTTRVAHDAFRRLGLGKPAAECYAALQKGAKTAKGLAADTGRNISTVRRALNRMACIVHPGTGETAHLVERHGRLWQAIPDVDLDHVAALLGTEGIGKRQHKRHQRERQSHARLIDAWKRRESGGAPPEDI